MLFRKAGAVPNTVNVVSADAPDVGRTALDGAGGPTPGLRGPGGQRQNSCPPRVQGLTFPDGHHTCHTRQGLHAEAEDGLPTLTTPAVSRTSGRPAGGTPRPVEHRTLVTFQGPGPCPPAPSTLAAAFPRRAGRKEQGAGHLPAAAPLLLCPVKM